MPRLKRGAEKFILWPMNGRPGAKALYLLSFSQS
jgi:hypothetical protein